VRSSRVCRRDGPISFRSRRQQLHSLDGTSEGFQLCYQVAALWDFPLEAKPYVYLLDPPLRRVKPDI
jgi:hypothetical protein